MNLAPLVYTHIGQDFATTLLGLEPRRPCVFQAGGVGVFERTTIPLCEESRHSTPKSRSASLANRRVFRSVGRPGSEFTFEPM